MSKIRVQCKGSGQTTKTNIAGKRGMCGYCQRMQDLASNGHIRKHTRLTTTAKLRQL